MHGWLILWYFLGRNMLGGIFPLVAGFMFNNLGYPGASSLLGGLVSASYLPVSPVIVIANEFNCREPFSPSFHGFWSSMALQFELEVNSPA